MAAEERYLSRIAGRLDGTDVPEATEAVERPALRLPVRSLDRFLGGFRPGTVTLLDSGHPYLSELVNMLCVQAVGELGGDVLFVDGGNRFDPYGLMAHARFLGVDRDHVLDNIRIARAFTAHQMTSILHDSLAKAIEAHARDGDGRQLTIMVDRLPDLYLDRDVGRSAARGMLDLCMKRVVELTEAGMAVTLVTNYGLSKIGARGSLRSLLYGKVHHVVRVERAGWSRPDPSPGPGPATMRWRTPQRRPGREMGRMVFRLPADGRSLVYHPAPRSQRTLDDFGPADGMAAAPGGP